MPIVITALVLGYFFVPDSHDKTTPRLDPIGALLSIAGVVTLVYTIIEGPGHGWGSDITLGGFALAVLMLGVFGWWEVHRTEPMLDLPWGHNVTLIEKLDDNAKRLWYAQQTAANGWSRAVLVHQIESDLYQRQGKALTNFDRTLPPVPEIFAA